MTSGTCRPAVAVPLITSCSTSSDCHFFWWVFASVGLVDHVGTFRGTGTEHFLQPFSGFGLEITDTLDNERGPQAAIMAAYTIKEPDVNSRKLLADAES